MLQTSTAAPHAHTSMSRGRTAKPLCYVIGKDKLKFAFYQILSRFSKQEYVAKLPHAASLDKDFEGMALSREAKLSNMPFNKERLFCNEGRQFLREGWRFYSVHIVKEVLNDGYHTSNELNIGGRDC